MELPVVHLGTDWYAKRRLVRWVQVGPLGAFLSTGSRLGRWAQVGSLGAGWFAGRRVVR